MPAREQQRRCAPTRHSRHTQTAVNREMGLPHPTHRDCPCTSKRAAAVPEKLCPVAGLCIPLEGAKRKTS